MSLSSRNTLCQMLLMVLLATAICQGSTEETVAANTKAAPVDSSAKAQPLETESEVLLSELLADSFSQHAVAIAQLKAERRAWRLRVRARACLADVCMCAATAHHPQLPAATGGMRATSHHHQVLRAAAAARARAGAGAE